MTEGGYTPKPLPLEYDSLETEFGCRDIVGADFLQFPAFDRMCITTHSEGSAFDASDLIAATLGPADINTPVKPYYDEWCFWVSSNGCRYAQGISSVTLPANSTGSATPIYAAVIPVRISAAFDNVGKMAIAIQRKAGDDSEITHYIAGVATKIEFVGNSPVLFFSGLILNQNDTQDLACYYLRSEYPRSIFMRAKSEAFAVEHQVHAGLTSRISKLISVTASGQKIKMLALDVDGNDMTFTGPQQSLVLTQEKSTAAITLNSGSYFESAVVKNSGNEKSTAAFSINTGKYFMQSVRPDKETENSTLGISLFSGNYNRK